MFFLTVAHVKFVELPAPIGNGRCVSRCPCSPVPLDPSVYSHSSRDPHAAHPVAEAVCPEGGHVILLDLHLVALEVRQLKQTDLVLLAVLQIQRRGRGELYRWRVLCSRP